jgi:hypothetical protein
MGTPADNPGASCSVSRATGISRTHKRERAIGPHLLYLIEWQDFTVHQPFFVLVSSNCRCLPEPALRRRFGGVFQGFSAIFDQFRPGFPVQKSGAAKQIVDETTK